ncbi:basic salivary proline-rich protein 2 isoform X3 [Ixodes scapularis]
MITRFGHFNLDKRTGGTRDGEGASGEGGSTTTVVSEGQSEFNFEEARELIKILELEMELERVRSANRRAEGDRPAETSERGEQDDLRHFSKALSGVIQKLPSEAEVPVWFEAVETIFVTYRVPRAIWGQLIFPHVVEKVRYLATRRTAAELNDYTRVKEAVLEELQLAPDIREYCNHPEELDDATVNPRYRGPNIPSRSFKVLQEMTGADGTPLAPSVFQHRQQQQQQQPRQQQQQQQPGQPKPRKTTQMTIQLGGPSSEQGYTGPPAQGGVVYTPEKVFPQPNVPASMQEAEAEPRKYTGGHIPSRSFKMLQAMTGEPQGGPPDDGSTEY